MRVFLTSRQPTTEKYLNFLFITLTIITGNHYAYGTWHSKLIHSTRKLPPKPCAARPAPEANTGVKHHPSAGS
jgi:hypothetical protein